MATKKSSYNAPYGQREDSYEEVADEPGDVKKEGMSADEAHAVLARFASGGATAAERDEALAVLGEQALAEGKDPASNA